MTVTAPGRPTGSGIGSAATRAATEVVREVGGNAVAGLSGAEVALRQAQWGPNAVSSHRARFLPVLWHQLRSPLLGLLAAAALSSVVGESGSAAIIGVIVALSVALGFVNEYRAEKAAEALPRHARKDPRQPRLRRNTVTSSPIHRTVEPIAAHTSH